MKSDRSDSGHKKRSSKSLVDPETGFLSDAPNAIKYSTWYSRRPVDSVSGEESNAPNAIHYGTWLKRRPVDSVSGKKSNAPNAVPYYLWRSREPVDPVSGKKSNAPDAIPRYRYDKLKKARLKASKTGELTSNTADTANPADTTFFSGLDLNFPPNSPSETIVPSENQDSIQTQTSGIQSKKEEILDLNFRLPETTQTIPPTVTQDSTKTVAQDSTQTSGIQKGILDLNFMPEETAQTIPPAVTQDSTNKRKSSEFTHEDISKKKQKSILDLAKEALLTSPLLFKSPCSNQRVSPAFFSTSSNSKPGSPPKAKEIPVTVISSTVLNTEVKVKKT